MKYIVSIVLALGLSAQGQVSLAGGRLSADALLWVSCRWQQGERGGLHNSRFDFYRRAMFVGLSSQVHPVASLRMYFDAAGVSPYDLYLDLRWPNGIGLRAGQFVPPLGFEAWTPPRELRFIEYSILERHWKPWGGRDIGVMASYKTGLFELAGAVVNGNGRNTWGDENDWKDVCGCVTLKPLAQYGLQFACRAYDGRYYKEGVRFWNAAAEALFERGPLQVLAAGQHAVWGSVIRNSFQVQAACGFLQLLEPVGRVEVELLSEDKYVLGVTGGVNLLAAGDLLKVMLNYCYSRRASVLPENRETQQVLTLQVQAAM